VLSLRTKVFWKEMWIKHHEYDGNIQWSVKLISYVLAFLFHLPFIKQVYKHTFDSLTQGGTKVPWRLRNTKLWPSKGEFIHDNVHLFIGRWTASFKITFMPSGFHIHDLQMTLGQHCLFSFFLATQVSDFIVWKPLHVETWSFKFHPCHLCERSFSLHYFDYSW
jgi:hypothetical protein